MLRFGLSVLLLSSVEASLRGKLNATAGSISTEQLRETVLQEVMTALGSGNRVTSERLASIESILKPTFQAMPKNDHGNLEDAAARYVLHRLFVQRHAMYIKGLEASGMSWNQASTTEILEDHVPSFVLSLFEDRLKDQGLGLHELTVLAATLEHLIHDEAVSRLSMVYDMRKVSTEASVTEVELQKIIDTYMTLFLVGAYEMNASFLAEDRSSLVDAYPGWHETQKFTTSVRSSIVSQAGTPENYSFQLATQVVEEIGERYGHWQDAECRDLKRLLSKYERKDTGRVPLKDFYGAALNGNWQFSESVEYLQELGALDKSDPNNLAVLIPNYVNSQSNCVASSSIYSVCCINECEALLGHLERHIAAPQASPQDLIQLVAQLPSASQEAKQPSAELVKRLDEVARQHDGLVPLHGRLFAQWLHHAYPRECPYPHVGGKTNPMTADEWMQAKGQGVAASREEMRRVVNSKTTQVTGQAQAASKEEMRRFANAKNTQEPSTLPWSHEEELVAQHKGSKPPRGFTGKVFWMLAAIAVISQMLREIYKMFGHGKEMILPCVHKQHMC